MPTGSFTSIPSAGQCLSNVQRGLRWVVPGGQRHQPNATRNAAAAFLQKTQLAGQFQLRMRQELVDPALRDIARHRKEAVRLCAATSMPGAGVPRTRKCVSRPGYDRPAHCCRVARSAKAQLLKAEADAAARCSGWSR